MESEGEGCSTDVDANLIASSSQDIANQIYHTDLVMEKIIPYISNVKDRVELELASHRLRNMSLRLKYLSSADNNNIFDMQFQMVCNHHSIPDSGWEEKFMKVYEPRFIMSIAGNEFQSLLPRRPTRSHNKINPRNFIDVFDNIVMRFRGQITEMRLGGADTYFGPKFYYSEHLLSGYMTKRFDQLSGIRAFVIRTTNFLAESLNEYWSEKSPFLKSVQDFCFHVFHSYNRIDRVPIYLMIPRSVRRLYVSYMDCEIMEKVVGHLRQHDIKLELISLQFCGYRVYNNDKPILDEFSERSEEMHMKFSVSKLLRIIHSEIDKPKPRVLHYDNLTKLTIVFNRFQSDTLMIMDLAILTKIKSLRSLHLLNGEFDEQSELEMLLGALKQLFSRLVEYTMLDMFKSDDESIVLPIFADLSPKLKKLTISQSCVLTKNCITAIISRCKELESLYLKGEHCTHSSVVPAILDGCKSLRLLAICFDHCPVQASDFHKLGQFASKLKAVILRCNRKMLDECKESMQRYRNYSVIETKTGFDHHMWNSCDAHDALQQMVNNYSCPRCHQEPLSWTEGV